MTFLLEHFIVKKHVEEALVEDMCYGDIATDFICTDADKLEVFLTTRQNGILCGKMPFEIVFETLSKDVKVEFYFNDGDEIKKGDKIAKISGPARAVLKGERLALNYAQKMSGIATYTAQFAKKLKGTGAKIADTRKNTPNFRIFEKYAVKTGGGSLHRFNLSDCAMLKDNHIAFFKGSIEKAVQKLKLNLSHAHKIEVECDTFEQVKSALAVDVDIIMLDNMELVEIKKCVDYINKKAIVEVSGNVTLDTVSDIAKTGVDIISTSAVVTKAPTLDLGFDYQPF